MAEKSLNFWKHSCGLLDFLKASTLLKFIKNIIQHNNIGLNNVIPILMWQHDEKY